MGSLIDFIAAGCAGIAAGCLMLFCCRALAGVELRRSDAFPRYVPLLLRLAVPFLPLTRRAASAPLFAGWRDILAPRLWMAGYGELFSPEDFVGFKLLFWGGGFLWLVLGACSGYILLCTVLAGLFAVYPGMMLNAAIRRRHLAIMKALPNVLDLLTLSVESGRDLMSALRDILARRKPDELGEELTRAFQEIQLGRKRTEALRDLAQRVRQPDLTATVNAIIQAEELGVSIAQLLRIQGDVQRGKRFMLAEKRANEASVKIIIPIVLFILPAVFIMLLGPLVNQVMGLFAR